MDYAIRVANLSKQYRIGGPRPAYRTLRDTLADAARVPLRRARGLLRGEPSPSTSQPFWALRDVSFEVRQGEVIGIIGRNGAGKSTLLKILSRITEPTSGRVELRGRAGTLLEVGTGFHPELTGRENVFLNGAILGMRREEIARKFDEIVAFAEVAQFIDTPVKHYSSGMYLRLAFAVAAHLEPEILIVDEVLAVGDAAFQKKCLGKMGEVARDGRTVLFVSHDLGAINALCERTVLLNDGQVVQIGPTRDVVAYYLDSANRLYSPIPFSQRAAGQEEIALLEVRTLQDGQETATVDCLSPFTVEIAYEVRRPVRGSRLFLILRNQRGEVIFGTSDYDQPGQEALERRPGRHVSRVTLPGNIFKTGAVYGTVGADVANDRIVFVVNDAFQVDVIDSGAGIVTGRHQRVGIIAPLLDWQTSPLDEAPAP
ncbi:MAG: ABC transporter ATP-binding protein [Roseiflexaceae bacterium]